MDELAKIALTALASAGLPSIICGLLIKRYVVKLDQRDAARAEEAALAYKADQAALGVGRECAKAITTGHHNGDLKAAADYADDIKHQQSDFMTRKAAAK